MNLFSLVVSILIAGCLLRIGYRAFYLKKQLERGDLIFLFTLSCLYLLLILPSIKEGWQTYEIPPYGNVSTGADPLYYYNYPRYRQPYMWPQRYVSSYPYPHDEPRP